MKKQKRFFGVNLPLPAFTAHSEAVMESEMKALFGRQGKQLSLAFALAYDSYLLEE